MTDRIFDRGRLVRQPGGGYLLIPPRRSFWHRLKNFLHDFRIERHFFIPTIEKPKVDGHGTTDRDRF
jgi:hypothetical protein